MNTKPIIPVGEFTRQDFAKANDMLYDGANQGLHYNCNSESYGVITKLIKQGLIIKVRKGKLPGDSYWRWFYTTV